MLITGGEIRHDFFRKYIANSKGIQVLKTYIEVPELSLNQKIDKDSNNHYRREHLIARDQTEIDFFKLYIDSVIDNSNPKRIVKGLINTQENISEINNLDPDVIISYGCSIIKEELISNYEGRFINIHLGLSPYYRGSGTNYFPFVNNEPQYAGVTFMHIDTGVDTGEIIHQIRPEIFPNDNIHQIGNRLIKNMTEETVLIINKFSELKKQKQITVETDKYYKKKDFTEESVKEMLQNFSNNMIKKYLDNKENIDRKVPIIQNKLN